MGLGETFAVGSASKGSDSSTSPVGVREGKATYNPKQ